MMQLGLQRQFHPAFERWDDPSDVLTVRGWPLLAHRVGWPMSALN